MEVIYLTASWCAPCQWFGPVVDNVTQEFPGLVLAKLDVDQISPEESMMIGVTTVPTLILTKDGIEQARLAGAVRADKLRKWIGEYS